MDFQNKADLLKALGHPVRLKIIKGLIENEKIGCNVNKMVENLSLPQSTVSQHISILKKIGIIVPKKTGASTCYVVVSTLVKKIIKLIF